MDANWGSPLKVDRKVKGETKRFRFHKPIQGQVTTPRSSTWTSGGTSPHRVGVSNSKKIPPVPVIGTPDLRCERFPACPVPAAGAGHDQRREPRRRRQAHPRPVRPQGHQRRAGRQRSEGQGLGPGQRRPAGGAVPQHPQDPLRVRPSHVGGLGPEGVRVVRLGRPRSAQGLRRNLDSSSALLAGVRGAPSA